MIRAELVASSRVWSALALCMQSPARADTDLARRAFGLVLGTGHHRAMSRPQRASGVSWRRASAPGGFRWYQSLARLWRSPRVCASGPPRRSAGGGRRAVAERAYGRYVRRAADHASAPVTVPDFSLSFQVSRQP